MPSNIKFRNKITNYLKLQWTSSRFQGANNLNIPNLRLLLFLVAITLLPFQAMAVEKSIEASLIDVLEAKSLTESMIKIRRFDELLPPMDKSNYPEYNDRQLETVFGFAIDRLNSEIKFGKEPEISNEKRQLLWNWYFDKAGLSDHPDLRSLGLPHIVVFLDFPAPAERDPGQSPLEYNPYKGFDWGRAIRQIAARLNISPTDVMVTSSPSCLEFSAMVLNNGNAEVFNSFRCAAVDFSAPIHVELDLGDTVPGFLLRWLGSDGELQFDELNPSNVDVIIRGVRGVMRHGDDAWEKIQIYFIKQGEGTEAERLKVIVDGLYCYGAGEYPPDSQFIYPIEDAGNFAKTLFTGYISYLNDINIDPNFTAYDRDRP